jgi:hypothetical protein
VDQKGGYKNSRVVEQTFAKRGKFSSIENVPWTLSNLIFVASFDSDYRHVTLSDSKLSPAKFRPSHSDFWHTLTKKRDTFHFERYF